MDTDKIRFREPLCWRTMRGRALFIGGGCLIVFVTAPLFGSSFLSILPVCGGIALIGIVTWAGSWFDDATEITEGELRVAGALGFSRPNRNGSESPRAWGMSSAKIRFENIRSVVATGPRPERFRPRKDRVIVRYWNEKKREEDTLEIMIDETQREAMLSALKERMERAGFAYPEDSPVSAAGGIASSLP